MKRSRINQLIQEADDLMRSFGFILPPFALWSPEEFMARKNKIARVVDAKLGWDITDYGTGEFEKTGLILFTIRNGMLNGPSSGCKKYAEKIMISRRDQVSPMHRHIHKTEDIINRGGATLAIEMFESDADGNIDRSAEVMVESDGVVQTLESGNILKLAPGESVTLNPGNWHKFWGDGGDVLIGEVSTVNDDLHDNIFELPVARFSEIDEDIAPTNLLVSDYETWGLNLR